MQAQGLNGLIGSGRPVILPAGVPAGSEIFQPLCSIAGLVFRTVPSFDPADIASIAVESPALLVVPTSIQVNRALLDRAAGRVGAFASVSTGTDHVDLRALAGEGLRFFHAPGANAKSVAEYVVSAVVQVLGPGALQSKNISMGIVGYGRIGSHVARLGAELGCDVHYYDPYVDADPARKSADIAGVLNADIVTLHVPLTKEGPHPTEGMIDGALAKLIRKGTLFINTSRGGVVTADALRNLTVRGPCVVDVFPSEPPAPWMVQLPLLATPHVAGYNYEARAGGTRRVALDFAVALGLNEDAVPPVPEVEFAHYVSSFFNAESDGLKADPTIFRPRRENYPHRGSLEDVRVRGPENDAEAFLLERTAPDR